MSNTPSTPFVTTIEKTINHRELGRVRIVARYDEYGDRFGIAAFNASGKELKYHDLTADQRRDLRSETPVTNYRE